MPVQWVRQQERRAGAAQALVGVAVLAAVFLLVAPPVSRPRHREVHDRVLQHREQLLRSLAGDLFEGNLTGTVHTAAGEDSPALRHLVDWISRSAGRVLFGGWPTGVAVTPAMQHGGPWPATTNDSSTSVGTAAIARFTRPVAYQSAPQAMLPEPLRDDNPWGVPQHRTPAGESQSWGSLE